MPTRIVARLVARVSISSGVPSCFAKLKTKNNTERADSRARNSMLGRITWLS